MWKLMTELCVLLKFKLIRISPYHSSDRWQSIASEDRAQWDKSVKYLYFLIGVSHIQTQSSHHLE